MGLNWRSWFLPERPPRKGPPESLAEPAAEDLDRIEELRQAGSRLNLPHPLRNFMVVPTEAAAQQGKEALEEEGFACTLRALQDGRWMVTAVTQLVPRPGMVTRMREQVEAVAAILEGEYGGWESPPVYPAP